MKRHIARHGFTLLEALLAIGIFAGGMAMVAQFMRGTSRLALRGNLETQAAVRCESMMEEYLAGGGQSSTVSISRRWSDNEWQCRLQLEKSDAPGLVQIRAISHTIATPELSRVEITRLVHLRSSRLEPSIETMEAP